MGRMLKSFKVLALVVAAILLWPSISEFFAVDSCLDAGGSFDYATGRCDHTANHAYVDSWERHGAAIFGAFVFVIVASGLFVFGGRSVSK
jgi:hypothetical protein